MEFAEKKLMPHLIGLEVDKQVEFDDFLKETDGTNNFSQMGVNIYVAFSLAYSKATAD